MERNIAFTMTEQFDLCEILSDTKARLQADLATVQNPALRAIYAERLNSADGLLAKLTGRIVLTKAEAA